MAGPGRVWSGNTLSITFVWTRCSPARLDLSAKPSLLRSCSRAIEYRIRYDAWWDRVRERPEERAAGFVCDVDWRNEPRWAADGLGSMMSREMDRHQRGVDNDASGQVGLLAVAGNAACVARSA